MVAIERRRSDVISVKDDYFRHTSYTDPSSLKRLKLIVEQVSAHATLKHQDKLDVLELGCGIGAISLPIASMGHRLVGTDLDAQSISECNEANTFPEATFTIGNAEELDLSQLFDVVIATEVIEHVTHPDLVLHTITKHLKHDGIGIVTVPNGYCFWEIVVSRIIQKGGLVRPLYKSPHLYRRLTGSDAPFHSMNVFCFHQHFYSFGKFKSFLTKGNFVPTTVRHLSLGIFPEWTTFHPVKALECKVADHLPHFLAGGWLLVITRADQNDSMP